MVLTTLKPASLAPCTKSITTYNKAAEHLGPRYSYNKNPFLPDPEHAPSFGTENTSPYMLMSGGKKHNKSRKNMKSKKHNKSVKSKKHNKSVKSKKHNKSVKSKKHNKSVKSKKHNKSVKSKKHNKSMKSKKHNKSVKSKKHIMKGGGHGSSPYGLPQGLVNVGREIEYGIKHLYSSAVGGDRPVNPDPSVQPIGNSCAKKNYLPGLVSPEAAIKHAEETVSKL